MEDNKRMLNDDFLELVSGGYLPPGWEKIADQLAPTYKAMYPNATYQEALQILKQYVTDPKDYQALAEYMKKYF